MLVPTRAFFVNNEIYMAFLMNSQAQGVSGKNEQFTQTPWCRVPEVRGPMQVHRLHRRKAGPDYCTLNLMLSENVSNLLAGWYQSFTLYASRTAKKHQVLYLYPREDGQINHRLSITKNRQYPYRSEPTEIYAPGKSACFVEDQLH